MITSPLSLEPAPTRRGKPPAHWADLDVDARRAAMVSAGLPAFRAAQVSKQWFERLVDDPQAWTDLPGDLRASIGERFFPPLLRSVRELTCDGGDTVKSLWRLHDGALVESVLMRYSNRTTICVSSQAGCGMACPFCATGKGGLQRNMSQAEIVCQVADGMRRMRREHNSRVGNVVFMGMGEPLANYRAVTGAIRTMIAPTPHGLGMSARGITVSTVGLVPAMRRLAEEKLPVTLALSLHAPDDELRNELVPINTRFSVAEALAAAFHYWEQTHRRVSIEYALMKDINDQAFRAELLAELLHAHGGTSWVHVNLIPLNEVKGSRFTRSDDRVMSEFLRRLNARGVSTTMRDTRGDEIAAACGQLAATQA